jgi:hypothetical protein
MKLTDDERDFLPLGMELTDDERDFLPYGRDNSARRGCKRVALQRREL